MFYDREEIVFSSWSFSFSVSFGLAVIRLPLCRTIRHFCVIFINFMGFCSFISILPVPLYIVCIPDTQFVAVSMGGKESIERKEEKIKCHATRVHAECDDDEGKEIQIQQNRK